MSETALADRAATVREALLNYLLSVKEFYTKLYSPEIATKMKALFPDEQITGRDEPYFVSLARAEKWWLKNLFLTLSTIDQMLTNIEKWRNWFLNLVENFDFSDQNIIILSKGPDAIYTALKEHKMDEGYVRLIVNNAANDFLEYIKETRQLLNQLLTVDHFIQRLESPVLKIVEIGLQRVKEVNYQELLAQMQQLLAATYNAPTHDNFLQNLSALMDVFTSWRQMLQLDDTPINDPRDMERFVRETRKRVNELNQLTRQFKEFVDARNLADYYIHQAELSTIRMMLSYEGTAEKWWLDYMLGEADAVAHFIPHNIDANQLLIGVTHSLALLEDLEQRLIPQMPNLKTTLGQLGEYMQSPAIELYHEINQSRLTLWEEFEKQLVSLLVKLRSALHELIKTQNC
ncbi:MAG: hypothetical protein ACFE9D_07455 [Promethearchaeota archaeon]